MKSDCKRHVIRYEQWDAKSPFKYYPSPISLLRDIPESISNAEDLDLNKPKSFFAASIVAIVWRHLGASGLNIHSASCWELTRVWPWGVHPIVRIMFNIDSY